METRTLQKSKKYLKEMMSSRRNVFNVVAVTTLTFLIAVSVASAQLKQVIYYQQSCYVNCSCLLSLLILLLLSLLLFVVVVDFVVVVFVVVCCRYYYLKCP